MCFRKLSIFAALLLTAIWIACPSTSRSASDLDRFVGTYAQSAFADYKIEITERGGKLYGHGSRHRRAELVRDSETRFHLETNGMEVVFVAAENGLYESLLTKLNGIEGLFRRLEAIERDNEALYRQQPFEGGAYFHSKLQSLSRGTVDYSVYLPPGWSKEGQETYPLIIFLHGQSTSEHLFPRSVPAAQLSDWIQREWIPPLVVVAIRSGRTHTDQDQWSTSRNETFLTSDDPGELRFFCREQFRAGMSSKTTSLHGFSRGASGALHYALKYPERFSSAISNAFVSDYVLAEEMKSARIHRAEVIRSGIYYRLSIGAEDEWVLHRSRKATPAMHAHLEALDIEHEYEVLPEIRHQLSSIWNARRSDGTLNGLYELKMHALTWEIPSESTGTVAR